MRRGICGKIPYSLIKPSPQIIEGQSLLPAEPGEGGWFPLRYLPGSGR